MPRNNGLTCSLRAKSSRKFWTFSTANEPAVPLGHLPFLETESAANVQTIGSLPSVRFEKWLGTVPEAELKMIKAALLKACAL